MRRIIEIDKATLEFMYFEKGMIQKQIGVEIGLEQNRVSYYFKKFNIQARRTWSESDIEYLEERYGLVSINAIANTLNKGPKAVAIKARRLGLGGVINATEFLNASQLSEALSVDGKTVLRWINDKGLKAIFKSIGIKRKFWRIDLIEFWKWAENNKKLIKWERVELNILGKEPLWVKEERKRCAQKPMKRHKKWTAKEDVYLKMYWNDNKIIREIAEILKRPNDGIRRRAKRLGLKRRKVKLPFKLLEDELLIKMKYEGLKDREIADELGRSVGSVIYRRRQLIDKGNLNWEYRQNISL